MAKNKIRDVFGVYLMGAGAVFLWFLGCVFGKKSFDEGKKL